ncbi:plasmid mobilization protein [Staphylococcus shinii]|uniref:plasmid mobilization protein n=1 Tax=Staphylococcus shinii TaxID=2912228 RepID=UPI003D806D9B
MVSKNHKKAKTININLTEEEYEKVKVLAEDRNLNPTAYTRLVTLGNRIKPTAVYPVDERINELEKENEALKIQFKVDHNKDEVLKEDYENIEEEYFEVTKYMDTFKRFLQYVNDDAEYINLKGYKRDEQLKEEIRDAIINLSNK